MTLAVDLVSFRAPVAGAALKDPLREEINNT